MVPSIVTTSMSVRLENRHTDIDAGALLFGLIHRRNADGQVNIWANDVAVISELIYPSRGKLYMAHRLSDKQQDAADDCTRLRFCGVLLRTLRVRPAATAAAASTRPPPINDDGTIRITTAMAGAVPVKNYWVGLPQKVQLSFILFLKKARSATTSDSRYYWPTPTLIIRTSNTALRFQCANRGHLLF